MSLLEVVVAGLILSLVAVGFASSSVSLLKANDMARERDQAREAARNKIEEVLAWSDYATLKTQFDSTTFAAGSLVKGGPSGPVGTVLVDDTDPNLLTVTVEVSWSGINGNTSFEISTFVADRSL